MSLTSPTGQTHFFVLDVEAGTQTNPMPLAASRKSSRELFGIQDHAQSLAIWYWLIWIDLHEPGIAT